MPIADAHTTPPPKRPTTTPRKTTPTVTAAQIQAEVRQARHDTIIEAFDLLSAIAVGMGQLADGATLQIHAPSFASEGVKIAEKYDKVGAALDRFAEMAPVAGLAATAVGFLLQIATNHRMIPVERGVAFGAQDPSVLESEMRLSVQRRIFQAQQEAKRKAEQQEAFQQEVLRMQAEEMQPV